MSDSTRDRQNGDVGPTTEREIGPNEREADRLKEILDWESTTDRTPYQNLVAFVEEAPDDVSREVVIQFSFKYIAGLGPTVTPRALERMDEWGDGE